MLLNTATVNLKVLEVAGLIVSSKHGRSATHVAQMELLQQVATYLARIGT